MTKNNHSFAWVLVADSCQAKIYRVVSFPKIEEISFLQHPDSRLHNQDLISSKPGRAFQSVGTTRHAYEPETTPKKIEAMKFATDIANVLTQAANQNEFERLYVIAAPAFLGLLRQHISPGVQKKIYAEIPKEMTAFDVKAIEHQLSEI